MPLDHHHMISLREGVGEPDDTFHLGIVGFSQRAQDYCTHAINVAENVGKDLRITIFISLGSDKIADLREAKAFGAITPNAVLRHDVVASLQITERENESDRPFVIETSLSTICFDDVFLACAGTAAEMKESK